MKAAHGRTGCECKLFGVAGDHAIGDAIMAGVDGTPVADLIGKRSRSCEIRPLPALLLVT